jgi:signal transduction histidine kinase
MQSRLNQYIKDRSRLLAAISHDLRTPITRLRLRTEQLEDGELKKKYLNDLDDMQIMVNETLDYMRGQDNSEAVQKIDINTLIESIVQDLREAGHVIDIKGTSQEPYLSRPLALKRCLTNLLENAIRYGEDTTVYIEESEKSLLIRIVDTGPGIPQEKLEDIFEPFSRLDTSRNRSSGGVGLGLGIARDIARNNGGDIYLRNREEGGLEAVLKLPKRNSC